MVEDLTNNEKKIDIEIFKDMKNRVDNYVQHGGKILDDRRIYLDYNTQSEFILYYKYKNMLVRYNAYVQKYKKEPESLQISVNARAIDSLSIKIPVSTFLDMKARVDAYTGKLNDTTHVYLDMTTMYDYINYSTYKYMLFKYNAFIKKYGRQPSYVTTAIESTQSNTTVTTKNCYSSPRWFSGTEMRQNTLWYCGVNLTQQILREITGVYYSESVLAKYLGTTKSGTGPDMIISVLKKILTNNGYTVKRAEWLYKSDISWDEIGKAIENPKVGLGLHDLYRMRWGHYEYPVKLCKSSEVITIANSLSGGYLEARSFSTMLKYINGQSGKSILIVEVE